MSNSKPGDQLVVAMEGLFKSVPALPANFVDALVKITPWLALIFGILGVLGTISAFGLMTAFAPLAMYGGESGRYGLGMVGIVGGLISSVLMLLAFSGLKAQKYGGWNLLFWSEVVSFIASLLAISIGGIIFQLIAFYILFQIKPRYK